MVAPSPDRHRRVYQVVRDDSSFYRTIEDCTRDIYTRGISEGVGIFEYDTSSLYIVPVPAADTRVHIVNQNLANRGPLSPLVLMIILSTVLS